MAVSAYERVKDRTQAMSDAIYGALDAIDAYKAAVDEIAREQAAGDASGNIGLAKRMKQFSSRAEAMITAIEEGVLDHLNFCTDRVFSVELAEKGEFI